MQTRMIQDQYQHMPWDQIDNVVFDVGNVLLTFSPDEILREYVPDHPELYPALMARVFKSPYWIQMDHGWSSCQQAAELMCEGHEELAPYIHQIMSSWIEMKNVITEGVDTLKTCHAHGKKTFVLSNYGADSFAHIQQKYDFFKLMDGGIVSAHVHLIKPDAAIYHRLIDTYSLDPARTLFIDDTPANVEAAMACGWQGLCFNEPGLLRRFFEI